MEVKLMRMPSLIYSGLVYLVCLVLVGCASSQPAPVVERAPATKKPAISKPADKSASAEPALKTPAGKDWRPDTYTVKKGDTLISIGLEFGYDYKEIAEKNNIAPPYLIRVGQVLKFQQLKQEPSSSDIKTAAGSAGTEDGGVVITPLKTEAVAPIQSEPVVSNEPPVAAGPPLIKEPKALREPYSEQALLARPIQSAQPAAKVDTAKTAEAAKPVDAAKPAELAKAETPKTETATYADGAIEWAWPVQGKILTSFNESTNAKGIDIEGAQGQAVAVSAPGKVIYSGSDLRGYGKMVIVKHNKTYLSVYAHNSKILVKEGQQLSKGQKIAEMGDTDSDRVKLHFEIREQGKSVDPAKFLSSSPN